MPLMFHYAGTLLMMMQGKPVVALSDSKWLCDLALMVDITKYLSELNLKL